MTKDEFITLVEEKRFDLIEDHWTMAQWPFHFLNLEHPCSSDGSSVGSSVGCPSQVKYNTDTYRLEGLSEEIIEAVTTDPLIVDMSMLLSTCSSSVRDRLMEDPGGVYDAFVTHMLAIGFVDPSEEEI